MMSLRLESFQFGFWRLATHTTCQFIWCSIHFLVSTSLFIFEDLEDMSKYFLKFLLHIRAVDRKNAVVFFFKQNAAMIDVGIILNQFALYGCRF